ncbi:MAG: hypothetical protein IJL74_02910 [Bacilli bacterium]|nr:hypothetical protein [Bacilli bacterium]
MKKYYRLAINCGRRRSLCDRYSEYGYIEVFPIKTTEEKKGIFGTKNVPVVSYVGRYNIIAELVDDHFEDIVLNKRIEYDRNGIQDIKNASTEELVEQLDKGLTCYNYIEIDPVIAEYYSSKIKEDEKVLEKYISELNEIEKKLNVLQEIKERVEPQEHVFESQTKDHKNKRRVRSIRSA